MPDLAHVALREPILSWLPATITRVLQQHAKLVLLDTIGVILAGSVPNLSGADRVVQLARIERRMAVHQVDEIEAYVKYLQQTPAEVEALFRDLLIGVTSFFRDPEAFETLAREVLPALFAAKPAGSVIRVWSAGCSTGEEAYSLAILLQEQIEAHRQGHTAQVFATDLDDAAIARARAGLYPSSIAADISPERLARFFVAEPGGAAYRVHKGIRDMLVFSVQDVIKDPPFSKLDVLSCRNLMIYLSAEPQRKLIPLFHYALNPGGVLFLGTSEGVGDQAELFTPLDRKAKLFRRQDDAQGLHRAALSRLLPSAPTFGVAPSRDTARPRASVKLPLRELTEQALLRQLAPAGALVNGQGDILYLHGRTGLFLEPPPGGTGGPQHPQDGARRAALSPHDGLAPGCDHARDGACERSPRPLQRSRHPGRPDALSGDRRPGRGA